MKTRDIIMLFALAALWGASFLFVRIIVPVLGPFPMVWGRVLIGGSLLLGYMMLNHQTIDWRQHWGKFLMIGLLNNVIPHTLIGFAQLHLTASFAALLNATTPLFSAVIAAMWLKEPLTAAKLTGLGLGMMGVGIIVGWRPDQLAPEQVQGVLLMLGATFSYGMAAVYGKVAFKGVAPLSISVGQLLGAAMIVTPLAALNPPTQPIGLTTLLALGGLALLSTAIAYLLYFELIASAGPTPAASVTLLIPCFSSLWGAIFLGERLESNEVIGFGVILVGLLLVTGIAAQFRRKRAATAS
jgi:drug/metabolite transporter (DMT)-like permease